MHSTDAAYKDAKLRYMPIRLEFVVGGMGEYVVGSLSHVTLWVTRWPSMGCSY